MPSQALSLKEDANSYYFFAKNVNVESILKKLETLKTKNLKKDEKNN
jgi:hypothetical protein